MLNSSHILLLQYTQHSEITGSAIAAIHHIKTAMIQALITVTLERGKPEEDQRGGTDRVVFTIPAFMHFQMKHEIPERHRCC